MGELLKTGLGYFYPGDCYETVWENYDFFDGIYNHPLILESDVFNINYYRNALGQLIVHWEEQRPLCCTYDNDTYQCVCNLSSCRKLCEDVQ